MPSYRIPQGVTSPRSLRPTAAVVVDFNKYTRDEIGISQAALNNHFSRNSGENDEPIYKNIECIIRKGALYVKPTTRRRKKQVE